MVVHLFGATSSPSCSSFALRKCAADQKNLFDSKTLDVVFNNFYVDDCSNASFLTCKQASRDTVVSYLLLHNEQLLAHSTVLVSKVTPLKPITIPCLELAAASTRSG